MARYHGRRGRVLLSTDGSSAAVAVVSLSEWALNMATDRVEVTAFGDANKVYVQGLKDVSGTFAGFYDDTETTIWSAVDSADGVKVYLYPNHTDAPSLYAYGTAFLDLSINTGVNAAVAVNGSFGAAGAWSVQNL